MTPIDSIEKVKVNEYDLVLLDYQLPEINGAEVAEQMIKIKPTIKILALSGYDEYSCIKNMIDAGVSGYLLKDIGPDELAIAIQSVFKGEKYYSTSVIPKLRNPTLEEVTKVPLREQLYHLNAANSEGIVTKKLFLTNRELDIVKLLALEKSYDEIANELKISKRTVESNRYNMLNKLNVKNTKSLVKYARELRFI